MKTYRVLSLLGLAACTSQSAPSSPEAPELAPVPEAKPMPPPPSAAQLPGEEIRVERGFVAPMPVAVTSFGAARVGQHVFTLGGYFGTPHQYHREGQSKALLRLAVDGSGGWETVAELDEGIQGVALVGRGNEVCRFGGNRILNPKGEPARLLSVAEAACFDTERKTWRELPPLPVGRSSHEATLLGDTVYVAGGWALGTGTQGGTPKTAVWSDDVLALDLARPDAQWRSISVPFRRRAVGVAAVGKHVAVIGGLTPDRRRSREVNLLDTATGKWKQGAEFPSEAFGIAAVAYEGKVYASASEGEVYSFDGKEWARVTSLAFRRFFHQLVPGDGELIAIGGVTGMQPIGRTRHTERVPLGGGEGRLQHWTMRSAGKAKNRQAIFMAGDSLYFFGGNNSLGQHDFAPNNFLDEGWRLHLPSMQWKAVAPYPHRRQSMRTVSTSTYGLSVGGFGHPDEADGDSQAISHLDGYRFDFAKEAWTPATTLPRGRTQFGFAEHDGELWVFGGLNYDPTRKGKAAFDHVTDTLVALAKDGKTFETANVPLPATRRAFAGAELDGHYYVVGGMREGFQLVDGCLRFSFSGRKFDEIPCPGAPRLSGDLVAVDGKLYLVGGSVRPEGKSKMSPSRSIEVFDPKTQMWSTFVEDVGFDTKHLRAMAYRDRLLLVSTHVEEPRIRVMLVATQD